VSITTHGHQSNEAALEIAIEAGILPAGRHQCQLADIETVEGKFGKPAFRFHFESVSGPHAGRRISTLTGVRALEGNTLCQLLKSLGVATNVGSTIRADELIGNHYDVIVENAVGGGTQFESCSSTA